MLPLIRTTAAYLTAAMLLVQSVCPMLAGDCGCSASIESACTATSCCCCCQSSAELVGQVEKSRPASCPHCSTENEEDSPPDLELPAASVCHCGADSSIPTQPPMTAKSTSNMQLVGLVSTTECKLDDAASCPLQSPRVAPGNPYAIEHFKQVVYCVWLT